MKRVIAAQVEGNARIAPDIYQLTLSLPDAEEPARPGQFVNVYPADGAHLLPRPISVCRQQGSLLTLVYRAVGDGTRRMAVLRPGETLRVSSPLGNGYALPEHGHVLLVGGGVGVPPLLQTAHAAKAKGLSVTVALGYRDALFLKDEFAAASDALFIATEDGSAGFHGNVVQLLAREALSEETVVLACGRRFVRSGNCRFRFLWKNAWDAATAHAWAVSASSGKTERWCKSASVRTGLYLMEAR